jgi:outer membrane protein assembly factor BamB
VAFGCAFALGGCLRDVFFPPDRGDPPREVIENAFGRDRVQWFAEGLGTGPMRPLVDGSRVYFGGSTPGGDPALPAVEALDRATGALLWRGVANLGSHAVLAAGRVAIASGSLVLLDTATGQYSGAYAALDRSLAGQVASDGARLYGTTHDGYVLALDGATGQVRWQTPLAGGANTTGFGAAAAEGAVAVVLKHFSPTAQADSGIVAVLEPATGAVRWRTAVQATDAGIVDPPVIAGGLVIVATQGHDVRAYDVRTGAPRWQADVTFATQELSSSGLAACGGMVVAATGALGMVALDAATGAERWRRGDLDEGSMYGIQCSHGTVLVTGWARLQVFDAATGARRAVYPSRDPGFSGGREFRISGVARDEQFLYVATSLGAVKVTAP